MAEMASPSTPNQATVEPRPGFLPRSSTVPTRLMRSQSGTGKSASPSNSSAVERDIDVLFSQDYTKVVSFEARASQSTASSSSGAEGPRSLLQWQGLSERILSIGTLQVYRLRSSGITFLHFGSLVHPIMRSSQCWCVDGEAKFVLKVRDDTYYRMELPWATTDDRVAVTEFREVLSRVLKYEMTPCPFKGGFHVDLPETVEETPKRAKTRRLSSKAKKWKLRGVWMPEDAPEGQERSHVEGMADAPEYSDGSSNEDEEGSSTSTETETRPASTSTIGPSKTQSLRDEWRRRETDAGKAERWKLSTPKRSRPIRTDFSGPLRSVTAPIVGTMPLVEDEDESTEERNDVGNSAPKVEELDRSDAASIASSITSYHTAISEDEPFADPESPIYSVEDSQATPRAVDGASDWIGLNTKTRHHVREASAATILARPSSAPETQTALAVSPPSTPSLVTDVDDVDESPPWQDIKTPPDRMLRMRRLQRNINRSTADLAAAMNYTTTGFPANTPSRGRQLTAAIVQKVYTLILSPADHLVATLLRIAERIVKGAKILHSFDLRGGKTRMAGAWDDSGDEDEFMEEEDDYGITTVDAD